MASQDTTVTIVPYLKVHAGKMQEFKALCQRFVEKTKTESGCLYYGYLFNGDSAFCREGDKNGDAALAHLENVGALLTEMPKLSDLVRFEIHGLESELAKLRAPLADYKPEYFILEYGFGR
jgi:quinol monooxygenase YgiN